MHGTEDFYQHVGQTRMAAQLTAVALCRPSEWLSGGEKQAEPGGKTGWLAGEAKRLAARIAVGCAVLLALCFYGRAACPGLGKAEAKSKPKTVRVITRQEGQVTHFIVQNREYCEVTMTFEMGLDNLKASVPLPYTATFPPRATTEAFTLSPVKPGRDWEYSYTNYYKLGSSRAQHNDAYEYLLPYPSGERFRVTQGYNGKFSHTGSNQYAIDWQMPQGTPVCAARGGVVAKVKDDSDRGGPSVAYDKYNNYVLIRHDDATLGHYCHLQKGSVLVKPGQVVYAGEVIAYSGNTGFSSGPHLHFSVFKTKNGRERESIPVRFKVGPGAPITLVSGRSYRASETQTASVCPAFRFGSAQGGANQ